MRQNLIPTLLLCFGFAACADHGSVMIVAEDGPQAPINEPDTHVVEPGSGGGTTGTQNGTTGETGTGNAGGTGSAGGGAGSQNGGNGAGNGGSNAGGSSVGAAEPGGGSGASPVPEPGTLLLVGTGLAGLAGISLRRRQRQKAKA